MKVQNLTIKFSHQREQIADCIINGHVHPIFAPGGETHVVVEGPNFQLTAHSKCVNGDMYWKDKGRKIALKNALKGSTLSKADKASVWEEYRNMTKTPRW